MVETIATILSLIPINNIILQGVKYLSEWSVGRVYLRFVLVGISFLGLVASSALTGDQIDLNKVSELGTLGLEILAVAVGSHWTYRAIKKG